MKRILNGVWLDQPGDMPPLPNDVTGVFETLRLQDHSIQFATEHADRFETGCRGLGLETPLPRDQLAKLCRQLVAANSLRDGIVRYATWRSSEGTVTWQIDVSRPRPHQSKRDFRVCWGPTLSPIPDGTAFKHLRRKEWNEALHEARNSGRDEAILFGPGGELLEGGVSNVFAIRDHVLLTPDLRDGPLPGIVRAHVLTLARALKWDVRETRLARRDLETADEAWLTNSLIGVRPVSELGGTQLPAARPMLDRLRAKWQCVHGWDVAAPV